MSLENNPNYVRTPIHNYGTKTIKTNSGIEYCVEFLSEDKKQTRSLWFKESEKYVRLNAKTDYSNQTADLVD